MASAGQEGEENGCFSDQSGVAVTSDLSAFSSEELGCLLASQPAGIKMSRQAPQTLSMWLMWRSPSGCHTCSQEQAFCFLLSRYCSIPLGIFRAQWHGQGSAKHHVFFWNWTPAPPPALHCCLGSAHGFKAVWGSGAKEGRMPLSLYVELSASSKA